MTKMTSVSPEGDCPKWKKFLVQITNGDVELQKYLQRVSGYCLTGITSEQVLFFNYGRGNNGKGRLVHAISGILHDYHVSSAIETFTASKTERHPTELAKLVGARLVTASETEENRRWAEARIKELTGQDPIDARFMRQDFFTYDPQFKLMFSGNHMPTLRSVNKAIARRFNRIPFNFTVPDDQINKNLDNELQAEWPGILVWMIEGLQWQRIGLCPPEAVVTATSEYLESQDSTGQWIEECCEQDVNAWTNTRALYTSWKQWAEQRNEYIKSEKAFSTMLEDYGLVKRRGPQYTGQGFPLRLKQPSQQSNQTFNLYIIENREKAIRASFHASDVGGEWLPRSQITLGECDLEGRTAITMPDWLAKQFVEAASKGEPVNEAEEPPF
jgi:putative DNA primase/helicase